MSVGGQIDANNFRVTYRGTKFPTPSFAYVRDLEPRRLCTDCACPI